MAKNVDVLQTDRLDLRGINESDAPEIVKWRSDPTVYIYFKSPHEISIAEHLKWYQNQYLNDESRMDWMCIERNTGEKIGIVGLILKDNQAEMNYILSPNAQHKGYAAEALSCLMKYAIQNKNVFSMKAEIHKENKPSIRVAQKLGFIISDSKDEFVIYKYSGG